MKATYKCRSSRSCWRYYATTSPF